MSFKSLSSRRNIRFIYDYRVVQVLYLTCVIVIVIVIRAWYFFISDQFKILAGDQLHYKAFRKKVMGGGNHYNTPHYPLIHTPYCHICCFWLFFACLETRSAAKWSHINFIIEIRDIWPVSKILPKIFFQVVTPVLHKVKKMFISKSRSESWVWSSDSHMDRYRFPE